MSEFPQFRKYPNDKSFFKILSESSFEELTILGKNYSIVHFKASNFLDSHFINDMLQMKDGNWQKITEQEYLDKLHFCELNFQKMKGSL